MEFNKLVEELNRGNFSHVNDTSPHRSESADMCGVIFLEIEKLKQENKKLLECVEFYARKISGQQLSNEDAESFPLDHNKNLNSYISGKRARQTLKAIQELKK